MALLRIATTVVLASLLAGRAAGAQAQCTQANEDRAFELFERSREDYRVDQFDLAAQRLRDAYELCPAAVLLYNLGLAEEAAQNPHEAIDAYGRYLDAEPEAADREGIERSIRALREQIDARSQPNRTTAPEPPRPDDSPSAWPWVFIGVGAAGLVTGGGFGLVASDRESDADANPAHVTKVELINQAEDWALAANVAFISASALIAVGLTWLIVELVSSDP